VKSKKEHLNFIRERMLEITEHAYQGFLAHGRGAVVIDIDDKVLFYFASASHLAKMIKPFEGTHLHQIVASYDHQTQIVVVVLGDDIGVHPYRFRTDPPPPETIIDPW
jgi:hypothetical protein